MDKWKDLELEKMKAGGNRKGKDFLESQSDYKPGMSLQEKYNSRAAALYKDKVHTVSATIVVRGLNGYCCKCIQIRQQLHQFPIQPLYWNRYETLKIQYNSL